MADNIFA